jgi:lysophospholipase L1-like esterase
MKRPFLSRMSLSRTALLLLACALGFVLVVVLVHFGFRSDWLPGFLQKLPFQAVHVRSGLVHTAQKLGEGSAVTIGFLGGSITQNAEEGGFVKALREHWRREFPEAEIRTVNAGLAGTDSAWGAKRIDRDLLESKPDLIFVEFAVNDGERDSAADMERIVRKIHNAYDKTDVVFLYVTSDTEFRKLCRRKVPRAIQEHEKVAGRYGISSVVFGTDLYNQIGSGRASWDDLFHDACHPKAAGYESYNRDFLSAVDALLTSTNNPPRQLPAPMASNFVMYPPVITAAPERQNVAMFDSDGRKAQFAESMPVMGSEWIRDAVFQSRSGSRWRLEFASLSELPGEGSPAVFDAQWQPARWFEEGRGFTGLRSRLITERSEAGGGSLRIPTFLKGGTVEVPQIVWSPAAGGDYLVEITSSKIQGHVNSPPASAGVELFAKRPGAPGRRLASSRADEGQPLNLRQMARLVAGEELLIRPFAKGYETLEFADFRVCAGLFDKAGIE